jgi:hypothetical protein
VPQDWTDWRLQDTHDDVTAPSNVESRLDGLLWCHRLATQACVHMRADRVGVLLTCNAATACAA